MRSVVLIGLATFAVVLFVLLFVLVFGLAGGDTVCRNDGVEVPCDEA